MLRIRFDAIAVPGESFVLFLRLAIGLPGVAVRAVARAPVFPSLASFREMNASPSEKPIGFVSFLRARGLSAAEWGELARVRDPRAFKLQSEWQNTYDAWLKATGKHPEFNETDLAELGVSTDECAQ